MVPRADPWHTRSVPIRPATDHPSRWHTTRHALALALVLAATACGGEQSDAERFCGEIAADPAAVVAPPLATDEELEATLAHYRALADLAPVAIEEEWRALVLNLETASTVVPSDDSSVQRAVAQAYATERSAVEVQQWLLANCSIDLGPVGTVVAHDPAVPAIDWPDDDPADTDPLTTPSGDDGNGGDGPEQGVEEGVEQGGDEGDGDAG